MSPDALLEELRRPSPPVVLDVRSGAEFRSGHVPGARHLPFWLAPFRASTAAPRGSRLVVYCGHGPRAQFAAAALRRAGFTDVRLLDGHWTRWRRAAHPVER